MIPSKELNAAELLLCPARSDQLSSILSLCTPSFEFNGQSLSHRACHLKGVGGKTITMRSSSRLPSRAMSRQGSDHHSEMSFAQSDIIDDAAVTLRPSASPFMFRQHTDNFSLSWATHHARRGDSTRQAAPRALPYLTVY